MLEKTLEFRGVRWQHLLLYLLECGGELLPHQEIDQLPLRVNGIGWAAEILREEEVQLSSLFQVNAVFIRFQTESAELMDTVLTKFRKKTMRVGG